MRLIQSPKRSIRYAYFRPSSAIALGRYLGRVLCWSDRPQSEVPISQVECGNPHGGRGWGPSSWGNLNQIINGVELSESSARGSQFRLTRRRLALLFLLPTLCSPTSGRRSSLRSFVDIDLRHVLVILRHDRAPSGVACSAWNQKRRRYVHLSGEGE